MPASNTFMNWKNIVIATTGTSPTTLNLSEVTSLEVLDEDQLEMWQADGHKFATVCVAASGMRGVTIAGGDVAKILTLPTGVPVTITAKLFDSINKAGTGCLLLTLVNAVRAQSGGSGQTNKFATGSVTFMAYSSDGDADPLTITQAV